MIMYPCSAEQDEGEINLYRALLVLSNLRAQHSAKHAFHPLCNHKREHSSAIYC